MTSQQSKFIKNLFFIVASTGNPKNHFTKITQQLVREKYIKKNIITYIKKEQNRYINATERIKKNIYNNFMNLDYEIRYFYTNRREYENKKPLKDINEIENINKNIKFNNKFKELIEEKRVINLKKGKEHIIQHMLVEPNEKIEASEYVEKIKKTNYPRYGVLKNDKLTNKQVKEIINNEFNIKFDEEIFNIVYRLYTKAKTQFYEITNIEEIDEREKEIEKTIRRNIKLKEEGFDILKLPERIQPKYTEMAQFNIQFLILQEIKIDKEESKWIFKHSPINMKFDDTAQKNEENPENYFYYIDENNTKKKVDFKYNINNDSEATRTFVVGFTVYIINNKLEIMSKNLENLKAYSSQNNSSYHRLTEYSTNDNKLCIYESYIYNIGLFDAKIKTKNNIEEMKITINKMLENEGNEIYNNVKEGNLIQSLILLTEKYNKPAFITFFNSENNKSLKINGLKEKYNFVDESEVIENLALLYCEKDKHIAPRKRGIKFNQKNNDNNENSNYGLHKKKNEIKRNDLNNIHYNLSYDIETYTDENGTQKPFLICVYGENLETNEIIKLNFYGLNCVIDFVNYLISISTKLNHTKTHTTKEIKQIYIYGFNNSNFDNIYIFNEIKNNINYVDFTFSDNGIKYIEFDNVKIFDICLYYQGKLSTISKNFNLDENKSVYPYKFVNENNLNYIGNVPELNFWNSEKDYNEYINNEGYVFNLKEYTIKYCLLDAKLTHLISKKHLDMSVGEINGKKYNVSNSATCSNLSMKIYNQVFQNDDLFQSPEKIYLKEKESYKAGRVDVFKKSFNENKIMYYCDRNSSYPASMIGEMPYKYITTIKTNDKINHTEFINTDLYLAKVKYIGNDENIIPNLLIRDDNKQVKSVKETEWDYFWGIELNEAIKNNFEIKIKEVNKYETKILFKEFVEYFYNERQKNKNVNNSLYIFYKTILNSFSGKFGQKQHTQTKLLNENESWNNYLNKNTNLIDIKFIGDNTLIKYTTNDDDLTIGKLVRFISYITANARSNLSEIMRDVGHENIYYCDTDSIFTSVKPNDKFLDNNILGKWKIEDEIKEAYFIGKKSYAYINKNDEIINKCKGVDASKIQFNQYKEIINNDKSHIKVSKNMFYRSFNGVKIIETQRTIKTTYNKRIFNGNSSTAFSK